MKQINDKNLNTIVGGVTDGDYLLGIFFGFTAAFISYVSTRLIRSPKHFNINSENQAQLAAQYVAQHRNPDDLIFDEEDAGRI